MSEGHYCSTHDTTFFKKGNMRGYAHPIKDDEGNDTGKWCNEDTPPKPQPEVVESKSEPPTPVSNSNPREHDIHKQVAYKGVMESCSTGIFPWEKRWEIVLIDTDVLDGKLSPKDADSKTISIVTSMTK